jgi:phosphoribosyl 1,2-cyclic phosphate phosphodiesterase
VTDRFRATILGCGASPGVPRIGNEWGACDPNEPKNRRLRCSLLVERFGGGSRPTRVLVDSGPDVRAQLLAANVGAVDGVIYTHAHADHTHGIDELRAFAQNTGHTMPVYADEPTAAHLEHTFRYCFVTDPRGLYPAIVSMNRIRAGRPLKVSGPGGDIDLLPLRQVHGEIDSLCLRFGDLAYSCDVSGLPPETEAALGGLSVWIVDGLRDRPHPSHFSVADALRWIERIGPRRAVLTHMTNELDYGKLRARLPVNVEPAYDGLAIDFRGTAMASAIPSKSMDQVP